MPRERFSYRPNDIAKIAGEWELPEIYVVKRLLADDPLHPDLIRMRREHKQQIRKQNLEVVRERLDQETGRSKDTRINRLIREEDRLIFAIARTDRDIVSSYY